MNFETILNDIIIVFFILPIIMFSNVFLEIFGTGPISLIIYCIIGIILMLVHAKITEKKESDTYIYEYHKED